MSEEPTKPTAWMRQRVDGLLVAIDDIENAWRQTGFEKQFGDAHWHGWIALGRLEDEGVAAGDGRRALPQGDHRREIEGRDTGDDAERLAHRIKIDAGPGAFGVFALEQVGNAAGKFDHFEAALNIAARIRYGLTVLGRQEFGELVVFLVHEFEKLEHHAGAALRISGGPGWLRGFGVGDRGLDLGFAGERDLGLHVTGIGIEDVAGAPGGSLDRLAADEMANIAHESLSSG